MKLKHLEIKHKQYYSSKPDKDEYDGSIEFFNQDGHAMKIVLNEEQMAAIVGLAAEAIVDATKMAAQAIVTSFKPHLQVEHETKFNRSAPLDCIGVQIDDSGGNRLGKSSVSDQ